MGYKVFSRTTVRVEGFAVSLVPDGRITLNAASVRVLGEAGVKSVLLLWDEPGNRLALKAATKGDKNAFAVSFGDSSGSIRAKSFLRHIQWNAPKRTLLPASWNPQQRMIEAILPPEHVGSKGRDK